MFTNNNNYNLINGNIITLNNIVPTANSITICDGHIESINSINNKYPSIDMRGGTVLPGLVDSHFHLSNFGKRLEMINLKGLKSVDSIVSEVTKKINDLCSLNCTIGLGLNPPNKYYSKDSCNNNNYIFITCKYTINHY